MLPCLPSSPHTASSAARLACTGNRRTLGWSERHGELARRETRNEARFRTQNEWVQTTGLAPELLVAFVCECGDGECGRSISLTANEYEFVRATSNRFAIALNHENPESEIVISECDRFAVVDKIEGWGLRISRETDPRSSSGWQPRTPA